MKLNPGSPASVNPRPGMLSRWGRPALRTRGVFRAVSASVQRDVLGEDGEVAVQKGQAKLLRRKVDLSELCE